MEKAPVPFKKTVFVCTHTRAEGRSACANAGKDGEKLLVALKAEIKSRGLAGKIRVSKSGCLDLCEEGPNLFLYPDGEWLKGLSANDAAAIADRLAAS